MRHYITLYSLAATIVFNLSSCSRKDTRLNASGKQVTQGGYFLITYNNKLETLY
jgi:hypothetical protein